MMFVFELHSGGMGLGLAIWGYESVIAEARCVTMVGLGNAVVSRVANVWRREMNGTGFEPRTETERQMQLLWGELLGKEVR